ncbi:MAG: hypothetical protein FJZ90_11135 [Chloroflexi bacterium]|nr:hypothetical protein [Chloroflexota bacterium]
MNRSSVRLFPPLLLVATGLLLACVPLSDWTPAPEPSAAPPAIAGSPCGLEPWPAPTVPAKIPGYTEYDAATRLHMTGTYQEIDIESYRLRVTGLVDTPLALTYEELRCLPRVEASPVLVCPGFFEDRATWAGVPIRELLARAGVQAEAKKVLFVAADGYANSLSMEAALDPSIFLAYEWEGEPLPRLHGFPLRVVLPGVDGGQWTKWVVEVQVK